MNTIAELRNEQQKLTAALQETTDEIQYDKISAELQKTNKAIHLEEARERKRIQAEKESNRKAAIEEHMIISKRVEKAKKQTTTLDQDLFEKIHAVFDAYSKRYDLGLQIVQDIEELKLSAKALELDIPLSEPLVVCNMPGTLKSKEDFFLELIAQYDMAARHLKDAKMKNIHCPDHPGMDWYIKGQGQYYPTV